MALALLNQCTSGDEIFLVEQKTGAKEGPLIVYFWLQTEFRDHDSAASLDTAEQHQFESSAPYVATSNS